jgi:hypothetical protein
MRELMLEEYKHPHYDVIGSSDWDWDWPTYVPKAKILSSQLATGILAIIYSLVHKYETLVLCFTKKVDGTLHLHLFRFSQRGVLELEYS